MDICLYLKMARARKKDFIFSQNNRRALQKSAARKDIMTTYLIQLNTIIALNR